MNKEQLRNISNLSTKDIVFAGTPEFSAYHLQKLIDSGITPSLVLTQPDRRSGRGNKVTPSPVKKIAEKYNIEVFQPIKLDAKAKEFLELKSKPDLLIVVAYGLLLPQWTLDWAKFGSINVHASLLPRWRGAAPIQRAIEAGDKKTGVGIMQMDIGLDTGDIWAESEVKISTNTTAEILHDKLQEIGAKTLLDTIPVIFSNEATPTPQSDEGITYAKKLTKAEAKINWDEDAKLIIRKINAFNPVPIAHTSTDNLTLRIYTAEFIADSSDIQFGKVIREENNSIIIKCGVDAIAVTELQEVGKKRLLTKDFLNGKSILGKVFK